MSKHQSDTKKSSLTASSLRIILVAGFILLLAGVGALIFFGTNFLKSRAAEANTVVAQADTINQTNNRTEQLWDQLQDYDTEAKKADQVVAESKSYEYQDVIIQDIDAFARKAGISIISYDFTSATGAGGSAPSSSSTSAASSSTSSTASSTTTTATTGALKSTSVNISVATPVDYQNVLKFLHYIEQNLTRMQIANVSLAGAGGAGIPSSTITTNALTIEVYIK